MNKNKKKKYSIAIDVSPLKNANRFRGVGFYTKNLTENLQELVKKTKKYSQFKITLIGNWKLEIGNFDIIHYPFFDIFFPTLPRKTKPTVVTVHDLTPLVFPQHYPPGIRGKINWKRQKKRLQNAEAIITDSQNSKQDIVRLTGYPAQRIFVIYLGVGESFRKITGNKIKSAIKDKYCLPEKFIFYVGDVNWNKNVPGLVRACQKIKTPLVIAGKQAVSQDYDRAHPENKDLTWLQKEAKKDSDIHLLGFVEDEDLPVLYNLAAVYCQPSFYEGFGMTVVEAMACGTPVVTAKTGSLPEIGQEAVLYFNPQQENSLAKALKTVIENKDLAQKLSKKVLNQAKKFSWQKCAKETMKVYQSLCP
ncbi:MAG: glycosyltransferase family 4 protein [Patescibacteria group bacterium]|jgi:glycosyltransferase involved in cell wall biosynthesis